MTGVVSRVVAHLRPDPWSELGTFGRVKRVANIAFGLSLVSMAVSASTASTDWDVHGEPTPDRRPKKDQEASSDGGSGKAKTATDAEGSKDAADDGESGSDGNRVKQTVKDTGEGGAKGGPA